MINWKSIYIIDTEGDAEMKKTSSLILTMLFVAQTSVPIFAADSVQLLQQQTDPPGTAFTPNTAQTRQNTAQGLVDNKNAVAMLAAANPSAIPDFSVTTPPGSGSFYYGAIITKIGSKLSVQVIRGNQYEINLDRLNSIYILNTAFKKGETAYYEALNHIIDGLKKANNPAAAQVATLLKTMDPDFQVTSGQYNITKNGSYLTFIPVSNLPGAIYEIDLSQPAVLEVNGNIYTDGSANYNKYIINCLVSLLLQSVLMYHVGYQQAYPELKIRH